MNCSTEEAKLAREAVEVLSSLAERVKVGEYVLVRDSSNGPLRVGIVRGDHGSYVTAEYDVLVSGHIERRYATTRKIDTVLVNDWSLAGETVKFRRRTPLGVCTEEGRVVDERLDGTLLVIDRHEILHTTHRSVLEEPPCAGEFMMPLRNPSRR